MQTKTIRKTADAVKVVTVLLALALVAVGCGGPAGESFDSAFECDGLADRWVRIQQAFLDDLGTLSVSDLEEPGAVANQAFERMGAALTEQGRDVAATGCEAELTNDGPALCGRVDQLVARGPAGEQVIRGLLETCTG